MLDEWSRAAVSLHQEQQNRMGIDGLRNNLSAFSRTGEVNESGARDAITAPGDFTFRDQIPHLSQTFSMACTTREKFAKLLLRCAAVFLRRRDHPAVSVHSPSPATPSHHPAAHHPAAHHPESRLPAAPLPGPHRRLSRSGVRRLPFCETRALTRVHAEDPLIAAHTEELEHGRTTPDNDGRRDRGVD